MSEKHEKGYKVVIFADMEGVSGVDNWRQVIQGKKEYQESGRLLLTEDINAAIRGLRKGGASEIGIVNFHSANQEHLIPKKVEKGTKLLGDCFSKKMNAFVNETVDAAILIGFHAMGGSNEGFMSHTISAGPIVKVNGRMVNEAYLIAIALSEYNIPIILVSGDQVLAKEVSELLPGTETVQVKTSKDKGTTLCLPIDEARTMIERETAEVLSNLPKFKALHVELPIEVEVSFPQEMSADLASLIPRAVKVNKTGVIYKAETLPEVGKFVFSAMMLGNQVLSAMLMMELNRIEEVRTVSERFGEKFMENYLAK